MKQLQAVSKPDSNNRKLPLPSWSEPDSAKTDYQNVYLASRREWNERYGDYISRERAWRISTFLSLGIALVCACGMAYLGSQNKMVPYVVEVDKLGSVAAVQRADMAVKADPRIIRSQLARWIESVRSVYQDAGAERVNIEYVYAMMRRTDPAYTALNTYLSQHDPFERAKNEGVSVEINSVLPISNDTWQVQWTENIHSAKGEPQNSVSHQANLTIALEPPSDEAAILRNPMGVYVTNFNWSQRL
jgi:type IV secretion system protein TrbF